MKDYPVISWNESTNQPEIINSLTHEPIEVTCKCGNNERLTIIGEVDIWPYPVILECKKCGNKFTPEVN